MYSRALEALLLYIRYCLDDAREMIHFVGISVARKSRGGILVTVVKLCAMVVEATQKHWHDPNVQLELARECICAVSFVLFCTGRP